MPHETMPETMRQVGAGPGPAQLLTLREALIIVGEVATRADASRFSFRGTLDALHA